MVEAVNAALDLLESAKKHRYLKQPSEAERAMWQARDAILVALAAHEREGEQAAAE